MFSQPYKRYAISLLLVVYTFNFVDRQILALLMEPIKADLQLSDTQLGFLSGIAFAVFYCTLGIPIARWADRGNRVTIISIALALWSAMTALCGLATNFVQLLLARIGVGIGEAGCSPPAHSLIADYFPRAERSKAVSLYMMGVPLGILGGYLVGGWVSQFYGWRIAFMVVGVPGVLLALLVKLTLREPVRGQSDGIATDNQTQPRLREVFSILLQQRSLVHMVAGITLATFAGIGAMQWIPSYYIRSHGMTTGELGTWLAFVTGIGGLVGVYLGGFFTHRFGADDERIQARILAISTALMPLVLFVALQWSDARISLLCLFFFNLLYFFYYGPSFSLVQGLANIKIRALTIAIVMFVQNLIGAGLGPQSVGLISDALTPSFGAQSLQIAILINSLVALWAAVHFWLAGRAINADIHAAQGTHKDEQLTEQSSIPDSA